MSYRNKHRISRIVTGLLFLAIGIGYLGTQLDWWDFTIFFPGWWSLFLILPAAYSIFTCGMHFGNLFIAIMGIYFLVEANYELPMQLTFPLIMAVCCICIGIRLLCTRRVKWYEYRANECKD